jgi:hypothetical protein
MSRQSYLLEKIGKQALIELWQRSSYSIDSLEIRGNLYRAVKINPITFKKVVSFLDEAVKDEAVALSSLEKLVHCLYLDCRETVQKLSADVEEFVISLREKDENPKFFICSTIPKKKCNQEEIYSETDVPKLNWEECCRIVPELLDDLDYVNQQSTISDVFDSEIAIALRLTPECEWLEKWLLKRLQKTISGSSTKVVTFQACDGSILDYQGICAEIDSQMEFSTYSFRNSTPKMTIEKLIQASKTSMILIKVGKLECNEYKVFIEEFYCSLKKKQILRDSRYSTKTGVAIIFYHCHDHISYLDDQGIQILPYIDIKESDVKTWMQQAKVQSL